MPRFDGARSHLPDKTLQKLHRSPTLLYDGECGVCNAFVSFILKREKDHCLRFASLYSAIGKQLLAINDVAPDIESAVLIESDVVYIYSDAVLRTLTYLRGPWSLLGTALRAVPRPIRDAVYRTFAATRTRLSRSNYCRVVRPNEADRFLDLPD